MSKEIDYILLGSRIRKARERNGTTQERLAEACSLSCAHIGHIERGTRIPSLETICKIAHVLNVSIDSLLIDNFDSCDYFTHLSAILQKKDPQKVRQFVSIINSMTDKFDELL